MEKIVRTMICDSCGKEIVESHFKHSTLYMKTLAWGGGSMGGDEDHREIYADLCCDCCCEIENFLSRKMNIKLERGKPYSHNICEVE